MEARFERDTLRWVKRELDATLGQARQALEAYIEDPGDTTQLGFCATHLHQVHGTLRMVELYGAAMLAEEMERLARAVLEGQVGQTDQAYEVLVRAILQLPDYLERLQRGERDIPLVLLPLLNDLRAARGEKLLSESALFSPDLSVVPPEPAHNEAPLGDEELRRKVRSLRHAYQTGLIGWFRDHDVPASLDKLDRVLDELVGKSAAAPAQRLWWVARAVVDALREGALDSSVSVKLLMGQIDRQMKRLVDQGEDDAFANGPATELTKNLLYYVARARPEKSAQVREVQEAFNLPALLPSEEAIAAARDGLAGPNQALMDNVTGAIKDDLARVKDALDLFKRGSRREVSELEPYRETLRQVGDTLAMLGFGQARQRVVEQGEVLERIVAGELAPDDERLLDMASALLSVEGSLEAAAETGSETAPDASSIESTELRAGELSEAELHSLVDAVAREAVAELGRIKDRISDFLESPDQHADLSELGQHFDRIWGSLQILDLERAGELLQQLWTYVDATLVQRGNVPEADALDALAEAVSGIEYFLEATAEGRADRDRILAEVETSLARLDEPPEDASATGEGRGLQAPAEQVGDTGSLAGAPQGPDADLDAHPEPEPGDGELRLDEAYGGETASAAPPELEEGPREPAPTGDEAGVREPPAEPVPTPAEPAMGAGEGTGSEDLDDEIRQIFAEEAEEELARIHEYLPRWRDDPADEEALATVRRSFHTLKGSGRLVGEERLGEFAWAFESMLNRVIDQTIEPGLAFHGLLDEGVSALAQMIDEMQGRGAVSVDPEALAARAHALVRGEPEPPAGPEGGGGAGIPLEGAGAGSAEAPETGHEDAQGGEPAGTLAAGHTDAGVDEPVPPMDPVLYDIFSKESAGHLAALDEWIEACEASADLCRADDDLARALHTLHGSARMAGAESIAEPVGAFERYVRLLTHHDVALPDAGLGLLKETVADVRAMLDHLGGGCTPAPDTAALVARIEALQAELGDPAPTPDEGAGTSPEGNPPVSRQGTAAPGAKADEPPWSPDAAQAPEEGPVEGPSVPEAGGDRTTGTVIEFPSAPEAEAVPAPEPPPQVPPEPAPAADAEAADYGEVDPELLALFLEEGGEIMDNVEVLLNRWNEEPDKKDLVARLQRELHTLKGGARMANLRMIGELAHALEAILEAAADGRVEITEALHRALQQASDRLPPMIEAARAERPMPRPDDLVARLAALRRGEAPETEPPAGAAAEPEPAAPPASGPATGTGTPREGAQMSPPAAGPGPPPQATREEEAPAVERRATPRQGQELVRVRSDLLESLVNYAGEVSIYRARLDQQTGAFRFNLEELEQTVARLREQLRRLELETEAQILHRHGADMEGDPNFDPLELDRYSQIHQLSRALAESVADLSNLQGILDGSTREFETLLLQQSRVNTELQEGLMRTRMVPFSGLAPRLRRVVRQVCEELGVRAELHLQGAEGEMDRNVLDRMVAPLEHMLRNSVSHGIESPEERARTGKPESGSITIRLAREGGELVLTISDDGRGIDLDAIRRKARERGLLAGEANLSDHDVLQFILESGFSTAEEVTHISGRGVGMDVVNSEIKQLGGSLDIDSGPERGTIFTVRLPFTLAINHALLVQVGEEVYAIPLTSIEGVVRISPDELARLRAGEGPRLEYAGHIYALQYLGVLLGTAAAPAAEDESHRRQPVLLVHAGDQRVAVQIDAVMGSREIVVKSVGPQLSTVRGIHGATILGDGRVVLILDIGALVRLGVGQQVVQPAAELEADVPAQVQIPEHPTVMVVDDSITMRKVAGRLLERNGMEVLTAKDGMDAVGLLAEHLPDVMLLDIEMPRMDGYELATHVRNDERLRSIPIIIITSRTGEKHRQRAEEVGVDRYIGKPYQETELLENIRAVLRERREQG